MFDKKNQFLSWFGDLKKRKYLKYYYLLKRIQIGAVDNYSEFLKFIFDYVSQYKKVLKYINCLNVR